MATKKKIWWLGALVLSAIFFMAWLAGLLHFGKIAPGLVVPRGAVPAGRVLVLGETMIPRELEVLGEVISPSLAQVSAQVPGKVAKIWVEAGTRVKAGDPLVTLSGEEYQARLNQARAGVTQAQAQSTQASANYKRFQYLLKEGAASPQEFEAVQERYKSAQAALTAAQAQVQEAATLKGYTVIRASAAGVVAARKVAMGDLAQPGQPLLTLYNPDLLQIEGEVNDSYRDRVQVGEAVKVAVPALAWRSEMALAEVFPISQSASRTFKVRTVMIADRKLVPGMFARLSLPLGSAPGLLIPQDAVHLVGQLTMVKVLVDGQATWRQVKPGRQIGDQVEVLAGLQPGDRIMLPGD
ncbi:MAG: efflux RND transporter periplasmic adaptor subunit [Deltaproteobacteria bacterium]|nr:efflux RND transporter periplasmic adaptor subunit [Deltaproteobacteria bacterium]